MLRTFEMEAEELVSRPLTNSERLSVPMGYCGGCAHAMPYVVEVRLRADSGRAIGVRATYLGWLPFEDRKRQDAYGPTRGFLGYGKAFCGLHYDHRTPYMGRCSTRCRDARADDLAGQLEGEQDPYEQQKLRTLIEDYRTL